MTSPNAIVHDVESTVLPNGIRIVTECMPHVRSVSVGVWIGTGSRRETAAENGISHFIEHMLFKGTTNRSAEEIARVGRFHRRGTGRISPPRNWSATTSRCWTSTCRWPSTCWPTWCCNPLFDDADIEKEKGVILEELKMEVDNPEYLVHETFSRELLEGPSAGALDPGHQDDHPQLRPPGGGRLLPARSTYPANIVITAAGQHEHQQIVDLAAKHFGDLQADGRVPYSSRRRSRTRR